MQTVLERHAVTVRGVPDGPAMVFAHGFGCDQHIWRWVAPFFERRYRTVVYDHLGFGRSDLAAFDADRYPSLESYADDLVAICDALALRGCTFVGHSVGAMIGVVAARKRPDLFAKLVLVAPSPRYIDDGAYRGGFTSAQIEELLALLDSNHLGWSRTMAPVIMGNADRPALTEELENSFCRTDPAIARHFARVTFTGDNRADLPAIDVPVLVLQCADDVIAPEFVGDYLHATLRRATLVRLAATGHCPNVSAPEETIAAIEAFV